MVEEVIAVEIASSTSIGTSTAKTRLNGNTSVGLPAWAKAILGVIPQGVIYRPTAAQALTANVALESNDISLLPYEILVPPQGSVLGITAIPTFVDPGTQYPLNVRLNGSENIDVYGTALRANTAAPEVQVGMILSSNPPQYRQKRAKIGTLTATGAVDTDVVGTAYTITGAARITELQGMAVARTIAADDALLGYIKYTSSEFLYESPHKLMLAPMGGLLGTSGSSLIGSVSRQKVNIPVKSGLAQVRITDYCNLGVTPASAGDFVSGVFYEM